jgi:CubicO group peptidase (beta-lactamase class C family)
MPEPDIHFASIDSGGTVRTAGDPSAVFPWWSFTKTAIAACALRLAEEQRLSLDEPLGEGGFTLVQLLQHTAGVPNYGRLPEYHAAVAAGDRPWPRDELVRRVAADRRDFPPGEGWSYSNVGFLFARERIEACTGSGLDDALRRSVLAPLGLASVRVASTVADFDAVHWKAVRGYDPRWVYHGCLLGTAAQACRLLHALISGELLGPASLAAMQRVRPIGAAVPGRPWLCHGYGLGLMIGVMADDDGDPTRAIGHSGGGPGCVNAVYHFPDLPRPSTVSCFAEGSDEGVVERATLRIARSVGTTTSK